MENSSRFSGDFSLGWLFVAAVATVFCCLCALWALRSNPWKILRKLRSKNSDMDDQKKKACGCTCSCDPPYANGEKHDRVLVPAAAMVMERQTGGSMMEQLVPEITTHALSYLDHPSLCSLSMTNSSMQRVANDDNAWKALYRKDFTVEQDSITPLNGWKSYYAATKAILKINAEFYDIIRERSLNGMSGHWLHADYVKCVHGSGELFMGYDAVMESWELAFNWGHGVAFQIRDVHARVLTDMAWVTMKTSGPFHVTNIYEFHNGRWYMVHHHSSVMLPDGEVDHHNILG
ncbi:nuclear transport factor 2 (NTF2) family protein [Tasmannia lanceolata]|uniref:nuclear transport factor 2 (NTF2) family protein n=1 Tax=Tasmannia lanceolata TaxID=3420 RepID=UPI0040629438